MGLGAAWRMPKRAWKVGLSAKNLVIKSIGQMEINEYAATMLNQPCLNDCIMGKFPSYDEVVELVHRDEYNSAAFTRRFGITGHDMKLRYIHERGPVGRLEAGALILDEEFRFLSEQLEEETHGYMG